MAATLLVGCGGCKGCGGDGAPEGMQLVSGSPEDGYYFYAPEEWTVANTGEVSSVYVSRIDTTSITFIKIDPTTFVKPDPQKSDEAYFFEDYFNDSKAEFPEDTEFLTSRQSILFGSGENKAKKAESYTFSYTYSEHKFGFMQIFAAHGGSYYIMTYASPLEEKSDGVTNYEYYQEKLQTVIDNFMFFDKAESTKKPESPTPDADGDILVTESKLSGFDLYLPTSFEVDYSSAIISATHADGSNITMTKTTSSGMPVNDYFELRKKELSKLVTDFTLINTVTDAKLGNSKNAVAYEYTYKYNGKAFHVYQIVAVSGRVGYVFTYTATEENYALHTSDIERIIKKVEF